MSKSLSHHYILWNRLARCFRDFGAVVCLVHRLPKAARIFARDLP